MACIDITCRTLPSGNGDRITLWFVTPQRPDTVDPWMESNGWYAIGKIDDRFYYKPGARGAGLKP